jgi:hypothetical protein
LDVKIKEEMKRIFKGTKKCAFCGAELTCDEIKDYNAGYPDYEYLVHEGLISYEEQCPHCGYHNDFIEEVSSELHYSIIT